MPCDDRSPIRLGARQNILLSESEIPLVLSVVLQSRSSRHQFLLSDVET